MISRTKSLDKLKEFISERLKVGVSRIRFTEKSWQILSKKQSKVSSTLSLELAPTVRVIPVKRRAYKIYHGKKKSFSGVLRERDKVKPTHKLSYLLSHKLVSTKRLWIKKIRVMRAVLRDKRGLMSKRDYRIVRQRIKGNSYRSERDLLKKLP